MNVVILGNFPIAQENSSYQLVREVGRMCLQSGIPTKIIGNQPRNCDLRRDEMDVKVLPLDNSPMDLRNWGEALRLLNSHVDQDTVLIFYSSPSLSPFLFLVGLKFWRNIKIGYHVDRSNVSHGPRITQFPRKLNRALVVFFYVAFCRKMLVVSNAFLKYYRDRGYRGEVLILPPLRASEQLTETKSKLKEKHLRLIYVGTPFPLGKSRVELSSFKDRLDVAIELVSYLRGRNIDVRFDIYGIREEEYRSVVFWHDKLLNDLENVFFHGKVDLDKVREQVGRSDFSVVIRDKSIMTDFGFSSKIVESIALGTRVITTRTSDIEKYLHVGQAIFLESYSDEAFDGLIESIEEVDYTTEWINPFEPKNFLNELNKFLTG